MEPEKIKEPNFFTYLKEACINSWKDISIFCGVIFSIWGWVCNFFTHVQMEVLSGLVIVSLAFACYKILSSYIQLAKGRMNGKLLTRKVTILRNGFDTNMDIIFKEKSTKDLENFAFVMGIDRTGILSISSNGGIVRSVLQKLDAEYTCKPNETKKQKTKKQEFLSPTSAAQEVLNEHIQKMGKNKWADETNKLPYGECVEARLKLIPKGKTEKEMIPCNLIFIANSRKQNPGEEETWSESLADDNASNIIVPNVFDYLLKVNRHEGIMIGVMGTNAMKQKYPVIFSQIINQYARICYKSAPLSDLYISIQEKDFLKGNMSLSQLTEHVRLCSRYYPLIS